MKHLLTTTRFKRDMKRARKRGQPMDRLETVLKALVEDRPLPERCRPHRLSGAWSDAWECHVAPDWLLIWEEDDESIVLIRTGSHADLFES
ncbi:type II toxin-antitoxin system YafQ family toxin [Roseospira navarrensis]|uniref:Type II toxin-antitoxin system mRNA interferase toxin, RelE/StbE family n=1 Tax=Roseospira navarrensis TaxID=140058 RepID=A0A7X2D469_9PROT|nr:type II toxin-antitoxin system YafQ family toxin [Roseospira navarrensis]MQX38109.1 type II toxin-antitoxin system mRNA interferase toxin, RelE/StbE family [Roseospira navarrensis]